METAVFLSVLSTLLFVAVGAACYPLFFKKPPPVLPPGRLPASQPPEVFRVRGSGTERGLPAQSLAAQAPAIFRTRGGATIRPDARCPVCGKPFAGNNHSNCRPSSTAN